MKRTVLFAIICLQPLIAADKASAQSTLLNYEHRVVRAAEQIERIKVDNQYEEEGLPYIKRLLPRAEAVDMGGHQASVDNTWLWTILDSYSNEKDPQARAAKLNEAAGRLRALDQHLQLAESKSSEDFDREAQSERLREILARSEYQQHQETLIGKYIKKGLTMIRELIGKIRDALVRLLETVFGAGTKGAVIPKLIVIATITVALILVANMLRRLKPTRKRKKKRIVLGEEVGADATPHELAEAAMAAARGGDFRSAIRKLYVSLLFELAERQIIELDDSATNHEYLKLVSKHSLLMAPMRFLTDRFDYVWYGMFPSSQEDFSNCLSRYQEAIQTAQSLGEQKATT
jgi:hypothetical protein